MKNKKRSLIFRGYNKTIRSVKQLTSSIRILPSFIIIGVGRCGTTSLYNYLIEHPKILPPTVKEIGFYDLNFARGINWYKSHFPSIITKGYVKKNNFITGEATPSYIYNPYAPKRIGDTIPNVKLIILLRNPVERAYSHYSQSVRLGREKLSFNVAIKNQLEEKKFFEKMNLTGDEKNYDRIYHQNSYISMGIYINELKPWINYFRKEQILILKSEDLYEKPSTILNKTLEFLGLSKYKLKEFKKYNYLGSKSKMEPEIKKLLIHFFKPYNEQLYDYLDRNFKWND